MSEKGIEAIVKELETLQRAKVLLEEVYLELGPYAANTKDLKIKSETWNKVRKFFKFDDSE